MLIIKTAFLVIVIMCVVLLSFLMAKVNSVKVYLIDFACYKPPTSQKCTKAFVTKILKHYGNHSEETFGFVEKVLQMCGLGDSTYLAEIFFKENYDPRMEDSRREVEMTIFGSVDMVLAKTGLKPEDIRILIVNCSIYNSVPSLSSLIVNHYKLRENVIQYNLTGMGCSASLVAIGLAKQLLQVHNNTYALVVSTEGITDNCYIGEDRSKIVTNCAFRLGGAAIILSNRRSDRKSSKYQLLHAVNTDTASSDRSYNCIFQEEDDAGIVGLTINKDLVVSATTAIEPNLATLARRILPVTEKLLYLTNYTARKLRPALTARPYVPDFSNAVEHFLPHVGAKPVIDQVQRKLGFSDAQMEASRMTLYRFGNTSSSSIWYELAYVEAKGRVKKGDRVWQIAYGSGFSCSSVVWRATKTVDFDDKNPWTDEIAVFPVTLDQVEELPLYSNPE